MSRSHLRSVSGSVFTFSLIVSVSPVWAKPAEKHAPLLSAVPDDVFFCVAGRSNRERDFLAAYWKDVHTAFHQSGIVSDVMGLAFEALSKDQRADVERLTGRFTELVRAIDWGAMSEGETVFAERLAPPQKLGGGVTMMPDMVFLARGSAKTADKNFAGLTELMRALVVEINQAAGKEVVTLVSSPVHDAKSITLRVAGDGGGNLPMALSVGRRENVLAIGFGQDLFADLIALLAGSGSKRAITATPRFNNAFAKLPPPEDEQFFFDVQAFLGPIRGLAEVILAGMGAGAERQGTEGGQDAAGVEHLRRIVNRVMDLPGMLDYVASVSYTDGHSVHSKTVTALAPSASEKPFYAVFGARPAVKDFDRYLPKETTSFSISGGIDLPALYGFFEGTLREFGPKGEAWLAQWEQIQKDKDFDLRKDLFEWIQGDTVTVHMPQPMGEATVWMVKVNDEAAAAEKLKAALDGLADVLRGLATQNPMMGGLVPQTAPATDPRLAGFHNVMIAMNPLVCGVAEGYLIVGTSADAVATCLATGKSEHPSIRNNAVFMAEGLVPDGGFRSVSFADERQFGKNLATVVGTMALSGGMVVAMAPDPQAQKVLTKVLGILGKLSPVLARLDFYKSSAKYVTFDGRSWHSHSVTNYADPATRASATPPLQGTR